MKYKKIKNNEEVLVTEFPVVLKLSTEEIKEIDKIEDSFTKGFSHGFNPPENILNVECPIFLLKQCESKQEFCSQNKLFTYQLIAKTSFRNYHRGDVIPIEEHEGILSSHEQNCVLKSQI